MDTARICQQSSGEICIESPIPYLYGAARLQMRLIVRRMAERTIPVVSLGVPVGMSEK